MLLSTDASPELRGWDFSPEVARILEKDEREREQQQRTEAEDRLLEERHAKAARIGEDGWFHGARCSVRVVGDTWTYSTRQKGQRMIRGIACTPRINTKQRSMDPKGCSFQFPIPLVCAHHDLGQIGDVVLVARSPSEIAIEARFADDAPGTYGWSLVETGEMRGLSVGSVIVSKTVVDGITFARRWVLREVSIVRNPANPKCLLEVM